MEHMQDKEFDRLFQQQFQAFEVEPSATIKNNIFQELVADKKEDKSSYQTLWAVAATITVIISVGTWFSNSGEKVRLYVKTKVEEPVAEDSRAVVPVSQTQQFSSAQEASDIQKEEPSEQISKSRKEHKQTPWVQEFQEKSAYEKIGSEDVKIASAEQKNENSVEEKAFV